jgi:hypothetical protein
MPSAAPVSAQSRGFARLARVAVLVGCGVALAGCNGAIETVRSLRGINKNDPDPVTAPFTGNMAAAEAALYPNLASVPPPPSRATTTAERQNLTEKLIAERAAAQAAGGASGGAPGGAPGTAKPTATAAPGTLPESPLAESPLAESPLAESPQVPALAAAVPPPTRIAAAESPGPRRAASGEPVEPLPRDSELQMPQVRSLPEPDEPRPAPAIPRLPPVPPPAPAQLAPAALASATPQPPPPIPRLAPIAPPPDPAIASPDLAKPDLAKPTPRRTSGPTTVAMLDTLDPGQLDPAQITRIAARYRERLSSTPPLRAVRIISYTAMPEPGADPLGGYHDALERAQGIAKVLTQAGIPEKMIQTEAKPAVDSLAAARVEIQFLP